MFTPKGKFGWYELMTSDTKAAGKFYSDVVGWTTQQMPASTDGMQYTTFNLGNVGIAGMLNMSGPVVSSGDPRPTFPVCFGSPSCPTPRVLQL
jgi:predicted enzyme related to lactoylglutathione lyase